MNSELEIAFLLTQEGKTIVICDKDFPNICGECEDRYMCYTQAGEFWTSLEYRTYWRR